MDFPREHLNKKRHSALSQVSLKAPSHLPHNLHKQQSTNVNHNKGLVRIEQYEYEEENLLGQGFTSKVYLGRLADNARKQFAIKVVDKRRISKNKENLQLLKEEIKIHKQLEHPNIVKCYDIIEKPNHYYFILEHCPHGTLDSFIKKHQKLNQSVTISIMEQIMAGYKYLLQMKVLHRDLKPPNILKFGPTWKICDFGFSLIGKKQFVGELNVGTPAYMAPQSLQRTYYSAKTDFFSLGIVCYEMLFGSTPWVHKNEKILLQMMKEKKIDGDLFIGIKNNNLINFIVKCLQVNERKRMKMEEFEEFDFWKETQSILQHPQLSKMPRMMNKTMYSREYPSTNHSQISNNTSINRSVANSDKNQNHSMEEIFDCNSAVIQRQLYYVTIIYRLLRHSAYFLFEESQEKQLFLTLLSKHGLYIMRRVKHEKINYLGHKKWKEYISSKQFSKIKEEALTMESNLKDLMNTQLKRKSIQVIRLVNKKFEDLTFDQQLSMTCMNNLQQYLLELIKKTIERYQANGKKYIIENSWTTLIIDYLLQYYRYVGDALKSMAESRIVATTEDIRNKGRILQDFGLSNMRYADFQSLKEQVQVLQV